MKKNRLLNIVALIFIFSHFCIILLIIIFWILDWFDFPLVKKSVILIAPLFAAQTIVIVSYLFSDSPAKVTAREQIIDKAAATISIFIVSVFAFFLIAIVVKQAINPILLDDLETYVGLGETVFGVILGLLIKSLYNSSGLSIGE